MEQLSFPRNMSYYIRRLNNFKINTLRLTPMTATTVSGGSLVSVRLPTNTLVKMDSLNMYFLGTTTNGRLPVHSASLINRVDVRINGQSVHQGGIQHFNVLYNALFTATGSLDDVYKNCGFQYSQPTVGINLDTGTIPNSTNVPLCVSEWLGTFIDTCKPQVLHTSLTGEIVVDILIEQPANCVIQSAGGASTISLSDIYFTVDVINFDVDVYSPMLFAQLQAGQKLPVYYNQVYNFEQALAGQQRVSLVSQSIDMLLAVARPNLWVSLPSTAKGLPTASSNTLSGALEYGHNCVKRGVQFQFTNMDSAYANPITSYNWNVDGQIYPLGGNVTINRDAYQYVLKAFGQENNILGQNLLTQAYEVKWSVGSAYTALTDPYPLFTLGASTKATSFGESFPDPADFIDLGDTWSNTANYKYNAFLNGNFMMVCNLKDVGSGNDERYISGYDTKGSAANIFLNITGGSTQTIDIFAICSSTLFINPNQLLEIIY